MLRNQRWCSENYKHNLHTQFILMRKNRNIMKRSAQKHFDLNIPKVGGTKEGQTMINEQKTSAIQGLRHDRFVRFQPGLVKLVIKSIYFEIFQMANVCKEKIKRKVEARSSCPLTCLRYMCTELRMDYIKQNYSILYLLQNIPQTWPCWAPYSQCLPNRYHQIKFKPVPGK